MHSRQCSHNVLILFGSPPPLPTKCPQQQKTLIFTLIAYHYQIHQKSTLTGQGFTHGRPYFFLCVRLANRNYNISVDIISLSLSLPPPLSYSHRGADETSTFNIGANLIHLSKKVVSQQLAVPKDSISVDCDAISVIISTRTLTEEKRKAMKDFFRVFGSDLSGCSLPHRAIGSSKCSGLFGCNGNMCQHLPAFLQGREMLVLDAPVKVGLHESCMKKVIYSLTTKGYYLFPSTCNGVCFDAQAASNRPPYGIMIETIIDSCCVDGVHIIHVADIGSRFPITADPDSQINVFFQKLKGMADKGISVELAQFDVAFVVPIANGKLFQVSCDRKQQQQQHDKNVKNPLVDKLSMTVFPIHSLPIFEGRKLESKDLKGTVLLSKPDSQWRDGNDVIIASQEEDLCPDTISEATDLFASSNSNVNGADKLTTSSSNLFSVKAYSTIAHPLMQKRQTYPLSLKSMYGIGNRSITTIQTLIKNLDNVRKTVFNIVRTHGTGARIEVSIRPHSHDHLRKKGHFNDILLHVVLALHGFFCGRKFKFRIDYINLSVIETKAMELVSQSMALLKFRHQRQFNEIYTSLKATEWLRAHLSYLLITIGICPSFGVKYINDWLHDHHRYDPYNISGANIQLQVLGPREDTAIRRKKTMLIRLQGFMRIVLKLKEKDVKTLIQFITLYPQSNPKESYKKLSFHSKIWLPNLLWSEIIPFVSRFMSDETIKADNAAAKKRKRDKMEREKETTGDLGEEEDDDSNWFLQQEVVSSSSIQEVITKTPMPSDPLCIAMHSLFQISSFSDPGRPGFTAMLFSFILLSHTHTSHLTLEHQIDKRALQLAKQIVEGNKTISQTDLKYFCASLRICGAASNKSKAEYLQLLCYHYQFPCKDITPKSITKGKIRNQLLHTVMDTDLATIVMRTPNIIRIHRNVDDNVIDVFPPEKVVTPGKQSDFIIKFCHRNLYKVLARCLNTSENCMREFLHRRMASLQKIQASFLTSNGLMNKDFNGARTLDELQNSKDFQLLFTGKISEIQKSLRFVPTIILPMVSLVYKRDFSYYDCQAKKTIIYTSCNLSISRLIKYEFSGLNVTPNIKCVIISMTENGEYQWNQIVQSHIPRIIEQSSYCNHHYFSLDPFGGRTSTGTNAKQFLPNQNVKRGQPFYRALSTVLARLDSNYIEKIYQEDQSNDEETEMTSAQNDTLGIFSFLEQLYSCAKPINVFSRSVKEHCRTFDLALSAVLADLKNKRTDELDHTFLCPIICLQHKFTIGVLEIAANKEKATHFYSFDAFSQQVEYKLFRGYTALIDHGDVIYFFTSSSQTGYYMPIDIQHWRHDTTIRTNFSYLSNSNFTRLFQIFQNKYKMSVVSQQLIEPAQFRPEITTITIPMRVTCNDFGSSLPGMMQRGINHHGLILIFPRQNGGREGWDACIVHHPLQEPLSVYPVLDQFIQGAPDEGNYNLECIKGRRPENSEANLYMILYAYIAHKTKSLTHFKAALGKLYTENDLSEKIRLWVHQAANANETGTGINENMNENVPIWIEQMTADYPGE